MNTHVNYADAAGGRYLALLRPSLRYLGVRHIRDGLADDRYTLAPLRELSASGFQLTAVVPYDIPSLLPLLASIRSQLNVLVALEGPNETDLFTQFRYRGQGFPAGTVAFMKDFYPAIKNDPQLRHLPVLQTTLAFPAASRGDGVRADALGDLSAAADYGNGHNYFSFGEPPAARIRDDHLPNNRRITPGKPMMSSEGGYQMGDGDGYRGDWNDGLSAPFSEAVHGRYLLRYVLEQYRLGYHRSFIYELLDTDQNSWGLFRADGTPRPAATGLRALIGLLNESRWDHAARRWTTPEFKPSSLAYRLPGKAASVHSLLVQQSNGTFVLILWNEVNNWNAAAGTPVSTGARRVTLEVHQPVSSVQTFLPLTQGTAPTATVRAARVELMVPDHPLVVRIRLRSATVPGQPVPRAGSQNDNRAGSQNDNRAGSQNDNRAGSQNDNSRP